MPGNQLFEHNKKKIQIKKNIVRTTKMRLFKIYFFSVTKLRNEKKNIKNNRRVCCSHYDDKRHKKVADILHFYYVVVRKAKVPDDCVQEF